MADATKILILEDVLSDAELAQREINKVLAFSTFKVVDNEADFNNALLSFVPDVIVSDYNLPGFDGLAALNLTQKHTPLTPFIIFTGSQNEDIAVGCMKAGASDYVIKEYLKRLGPAVLQALEKKKALLEKAQMERDLVESEKKYRTIFENIQDIYYETALDGTVLEVSPSISSLSYTREEVIGTNMLKYYVDPEQRATLLQTLVRNGNVTDYEVLLEDRHGNMLTVSITASVFPQEKNGQNKISGVMRNVSERVKFVHELQAEKEKAEEMNRLKSFFLANMSHELRTPLSGILGFSELLTTITTDVESQEMVQMIHKSGKRLLNTLNSILDLSRIEANQTEIHWQTIDLNQFMDETIKHFEPIACSKSLGINFTTDLKDVDFNTDARMLEHVVNAVLDNAIKFTEQGEIEVNLEQLVIERKKWITIRVIDTGIGIEHDKKNVIFEPFRQVSEGYSRSFEGTGLGLTIAHKFMELLGGCITLESTSQEGSTFLLKFPYNHEHFPEEETDVKKKSEVKNKTVLAKEDFLILPKLLLVDDDEVTRIMVQLMLQNVYDIEFASTGKEALIMIDETQYQIILLDINLKENISGIDIIRLLRKSSRYASTPIVAATAYTMLGDREKFLAEGFTEYLPKPFTKDDLVKIIQFAEKLL